MRKTLNATDRLLLSYAESAELLGLSERTVRELVYDGELEAVHFGRARRIPRQALEALIEKRRSDKNVVMPGGTVETETP